jgi:glycosyltransferase involved in cell wall biosynthesis
LELNETFDRLGVEIDESPLPDPVRLRQAIIVVGSHRSGTSALARVLSLVGCDLPKHVMPALEHNNEPGFWEPLTVVQAHDDFLAKIGSSWDDVTTLPDGAFVSAAALDLRRQLALLLQEEFGTSPLFVVKDPRISRLLPLWFAVLTELQIRPFTAIAVRNPLEVAASLKARDGFTTTKSLLLWLRHTLESEQHSRGQSRSIVMYDELLRDWQGVLARVGEDLDLTWPAKSNRAVVEVESFLSEQHRHHSFDWAELEGRADVVSWVKETYFALRTSEPPPVLDQVRDELAEADTAFGPIVEEARLAVQASQSQALEAAAARDALAAEIDARAAEVQQLREEVGQLDSTVAASAAEAATHRAEMATLCTERDDLAQEVGRLGAEVSHLSGAVEMAERHTATALAEASRLAKQLEEAERDAAELTSAADELLAAADTERERLQAEVEDALEEQGQLLILVERLEAERDTARSQAEQLAADAAGFGAALSAQRERLHALQRVTKRRVRRRRTLSQLASWLLPPTPRKLKFLGRYLFLRWFGRFDVDWYLLTNRDVVTAGVNPLMHYIEHGSREGRAPAPSQGLRMLEAPPASAYETAVDPAVAREFDAAFYRERYPDLSGSDADLLEHYLTSGWREDRDPCAWFSTAYYLARNPDIRENGLNPFVHFVMQGRREGRLPSAYRVTKLVKGYEPTVSAVVPAFNHAPFLRQRIESIVAQDRPPTEIVILDDASTDGSRELIEQIGREVDIPLVVDFNGHNSGNVFKQWRKGLELAGGDLVWICESDDFCSDRFLGRLVPYFADPSVTLAFGRVQVADEDGRPGTWLDEYREAAAAGYWNEPRVESAYEWFRGPFGRRNVIPNVGGCLFRRQELPTQVWQEAQRYSVCGDWYLYMQIAGGGRIAFDPEAISYFRQHGANTSVTSFAKLAYYREHAAIASELRGRYGIDDARLRELHRSALEQFRRNFPEEPEASFDRVFDLRALRSRARETRHILMGILGFKTGGAEIFPINLANALVERGYVVSVVVLDTQGEEPNVRARLRPQIPVYERGLVEEIGLDRFLQDYGIDLVHTHYLGVDRWLHRACRDAGLPYVVTLHGSYEVGNLDDQTTAALLESVSRWVYTAEKNLRVFDRTATDRAAFTKMANAVPDTEPGLRLSRQEHGISDDAFVFGVASRAIWSKGWDIAVKALAQVAADTDRPVCVALCGAGESYDDLVAELGGLPGVRFLGHQKNVIAFYRMCDCCLLPTRFPGESFPLTLIESLLAETPIIATDIGEIRSIVESDGDTAGIVVPLLSDDDDFTLATAAAMSRMLEEHETFAGGAKRLAKKYSFERLTMHYEELYHATAKWPARSSGDRSAIG